MNSLSQLFYTLRILNGNWVVTLMECYHLNIIHILLPSFINIRHAYNFTTFDMSDKYTCVIYICRDKTIHFEELNFTNKLSHYNNVIRSKGNCLNAWRYKDRKFYNYTSMFKMKFGLVD